MSQAQGVASNRKIIYAGERARAIYNVLSFMVNRLPRTDISILQMLVPEVFHIGYGVSQLGPGTVKIVDAEKTDVLVNLIDETLHAETLLDVASVRRLIEKLIKVFYNYLFVLNAYYGRSDWANDLWDVLSELVSSGVDEDFATVLWDLAVVDPEVVSKLARFLPSTYTVVKLPSEVLNELKKHAVSTSRNVYVFGKIYSEVGKFDVAVSYYPFTQSMTVRLVLYDIQRRKKEDVELEVSVSSGGVARLRLLVFETPSEHVLEWVISNRCNVLKQAIEMIEKQVLREKTLLESVRSFEKAVEVICTETASRSTR